MLLEKRLGAHVAWISACVPVTPKFDKVAPQPAISIVPSEAERLWVSIVMELPGEIQTLIFRSSGT